MKPIGSADNGSPEWTGGQRAAWAAILTVLQLLLLASAALTLAGCTAGPSPQRRPTPTPKWRVTPWPGATRERPVPIATLQPSRVPMPTLSPLQILSRSLATPEAPVVAAEASYLTNERCYGDCVDLGNTSLMMHDFAAYWDHPDPVNVDYYEVWRSTNDPYFDPDSCAGCTLTVTTAMTGTVVDSPPAFNPVSGTEDGGSSDLDVFVVRAVNAAGASDASNRIGVIVWSFLVAEENYNPNFGIWPPPTPTYAP